MDNQGHKMPTAVEKCSSGIDGLDEITGGGFPKGRATLLAGNAGCGKTVFSMLFLIKGALEHNEAGVFVALEEQPEALIRNFASFGFNLQDLIDRRLLTIIQVALEDTGQAREGKYDMGSCFIKLADAIASVKAKRIAIDTLDALFVGASDFNLLRTQLRGLFNWLVLRGVTVVATGEAGLQTLTRRGIEEYVADCVIKLDYRVAEQLSTRRLRVIKYRGSSHPSDEFPFLIDKKEITVMPITSVKLEYRPTGEHIPTGVRDLDRMLGGSGLFRGSSILISGTPGSGKTSLAFTFIDAACRRGERAAYFGFEESSEQIYLNMTSIGLDVKQWVEKGLLLVYTSRASMYGLETHLVNIYRTVEEFAPAVVVVDPMTSLADVGTVLQAKSMLTRLIDFLKMHATTSLLTDLTHEESIQVSTKEEISSLIDTWFLLRDKEIEAERFRTLLVLKSRGMPHSNLIHKFILSDRGITLQRMKWHDERGYQRRYLEGWNRGETERRTHERRQGERRISTV
ncbi:circadian clock protein KaiC [Geotalea sp. SG265]|uniref:circadian clock protein KaiC n=1 Tax=Geotalea sp. SG265 TaxID=2922867 RepID=UPI001FAEF937|nr:circadian clock protein KaiC [Geotalea sp. SG265]